MSEVSGGFLTTALIQAIYCMQTAQVDIMSLTTHLR